jgi:hypothetical protein
VRLSTRKFLELTANAVENAVGVPPNRITAILKDERRIRGDTAILLRKVFQNLGGIPDEPANDPRPAYAEKALPARVRKSFEDNRNVLA